MAQTFSSIIRHIAFSTKSRRPLITDDVHPRLYEYMGGVVRGERGMLHGIGGTDDHVRILIRWRTDQRRCGAFSACHSQKERVRTYIQGQEGHHKCATFREEFIALLIAHDIAHDERSIWD